ncbi:MAG: serine hydrolase [Gemmatimonadaceae bacterium]|nr:serine hydrolase [Gemmatimonadaceae bacterium]
MRPPNMLLLLAALLTQQPDSAALARAERYFAETDGQAMLVMHRGAIVYERYRAGGSTGSRQLLASGSKSFVGVGAIAAAADGLLKLDQTVATYLPDWSSDARKSRITVRQLLSLESGLESGNAGTGCGGPRATWQDAVNAGTFAEPGSAFRYGPFPFIAAGSVVEKVQSKSFEQYLKARILEPLGVTVEWRLKCGDGKPQLAGGAAMTARDWATFGEFIRNGGVHRGKRILPEALVRELFVPSHANPAYGLSWWLVGATIQAQPALGLEAAGGARNGARAGRRAAAIMRGRRAGANARGGRGDDTPSAMPTWMPRDVVMAAGAGKQRLYVIPSHELVIVRMGPVRGGQEFADVEFLGALFGPAN